MQLFIPPVFSLCLCTVSTENSDIGDKDAGNQNMVIIRHQEVMWLFNYHLNAVCPIFQLEYITFYIMMTIIECKSHSFEDLKV